MRLDLFLKVLRILKQRTVAKQACEMGAVLLNGEVTKASAVVRVGDRLSVDMPAFVLEAEVLEVPRNNNVPRKDVERYVRVVQHRSRDPRTYVFGESDPPQDAGPDVSS